MALYERFWPDCPWPLVFASDGGEIQSTTFDRVTCENGLDWSSCLIAYLRQLKGDYVLLALDDFFLRRRVDTELLTELLRELYTTGGVCMRLVPRPKPRMYLSRKRYLGEICPGEAYRVSTQAAFWQREALIDLLAPGESAWAFEINGTHRSNSLFSTGFYGVYKSAFPYFHHVVQRGRWFPWEAWYFSRMKIGCDISARGTLSIAESAHWLLKKIVQRLGLLGLVSLVAKNLKLQKS